MAAAIHKQFSQLPAACENIYRKKEFFYKEKQRELKQEAQTMVTLKGSSTKKK